MDNRERKFYARGVYPTQDTSRMGTATPISATKKRDTIIIAKSSMKSGRKLHGYEQVSTCDEVLTIMLLGGHSFSIQLIRQN